MFRYEANLHALQGKANALFDLGRYEEAVSAYDELMVELSTKAGISTSKA